MKKHRAGKGKKAGKCWRCGNPSWMLTGYVCDLHLIKPKQTQAR